MSIGIAASLCALQLEISRAGAECSDHIVDISTFPDDSKKNIESQLRFMSRNVASVTRLELSDADKYLITFKRWA